MNISSFVTRLLVTRHSFPFEASFLSTAHDDEAVNLTHTAAAAAFASFTS